MIFCAGGECTPVMASDAGKNISILTVAIKPTIMRKIFIVASARVAHIANPMKHKGHNTTLWIPAVEVSQPIVQSHAIRYAIHGDMKTGVNPAAEVKQELMIPGPQFARMRGLRRG